MLRYLEIPFASAFLPDCVAAIGLRDMAEPCDVSSALTHMFASSTSKSRNRELQKMVGLALIDSGGIPHLREATPDAAVAGQTHSRERASAMHVIGLVAPQKVLTAIEKFPRAAAGHGS